MLTTDNQSTTKNNRAITLTGANSIFSAIGVVIEQSELGFYTTTYNDRQFAHRTLTGLCQQLIKYLEFRK